MRKLAFLLIIIGLSLMLYPSINHWYEDYKQQLLLNNWETIDMNILDQEPASSESVASQINALFPSDHIASAFNPSSTPTVKDVNKPMIVALSPNSDHSVKLQKPLANKKTMAPPQPGVIGVLQIDIIGLKLPVVEGISAADMRIAPGHIPGTAFPGQVGNAVIAGHRSYTYGRMFNRLEELKAGDNVKVETGGHINMYTIYDKKIVDPTDLSVLNHNNTDKILTLITCDAEGKRRLILQAKLN